VDPYANVYLTGITISFDYPLVRALQATPGGGTQDAFFAKVGFSNPNNIPAGDIVTAVATPGDAVSRFQRGGMTPSAAAGRLSRAELDSRRKQLKTSPYEERFRRHRGFDAAVAAR
jgi:hypothetical protein